MSAKRRRLTPDAGPRHNLPGSPDAFVGRVRELSEINSALRGARLLTLSGPGGVGKTRLALELARLQLRHRTDGAWLAELAPVIDPAAVPGEVAAALKINPQRGQVTLDDLVDDLASRDLLLVLDNCEQVVDACAALAAALLAGCPKCRLVVTSREPLRIAGETTWRVSPLDPEDSVRLFVERARRRRGDLQPIDADDPAIAQVCGRLDHLPLAIELAASRITSMTPSEMLVRLERSLGLLTRGDRMGLPRHQTMRATIRWSYGLLSPNEQHLLRRLAIFVGSFDLAAAIAVGHDTRLEVLESLVDKSLVGGRPEAAGQTRYRLLETVREFALDQLSDAGEVEATRDRHLQHFVARAEPVFEEWCRSGSDAPAHRLDADYENIRAALEWSLGTDPKAGLKLVAATRDIWMRMGQSEGWRLAGLLLETASARDRDRAGALIAAGHLALTHMRHEEAGRLLGAARALSAELGEGPLEAWATHYAGLSSALDGEPERAIELLEAGLESFRRLGMRLGEARALSVIGIARFTREDFAGARDGLEAGVTINREENDPWGEAVCLTYLGLIAAAAGDEEIASQHYRLAVDLFRPFNDGVVMPIALVGQAALLARSAPERAVRTAAAAEALRSGAGGDFPPFVRIRLDEIRSTAMAALGGAVDRAWSEGARLDVNGAVGSAFGRGRPRRAGAGGLTEREIQVARLVADGLTNKAIAGRLHLSVRTVESHIFSALSKLNMDNRIQLATWTQKLPR